MTEIAQHVVAARGADDAFVVRGKALLGELAQTEHAQDDLVGQVLLHVGGQRADAGFRGITLARGARGQQPWSDQRQRHQCHADQRELPVGPQQQPERDHHPTQRSGDIADRPERRLDAARVAGDTGDHVTGGRGTQP